MATILIIDDDPAIRSLLREMLESAGYAVCEAENGRDGIAAYRDRLPDLVVADIHMPEINGLDAVRELSKEFTTVRAIIISGDISAVSRINSAKSLLGVRQALLKPVDAGQFLEAIRYELTC